MYLKAPSQLYFTKVTSTPPIVNDHSALEATLTTLLISCLLLILRSSVQRSMSQLSTHNTCPLYTHVSPFLQCVGPFNLFRSVWTMFVYNKGGWTICWWKYVFKTPSTVFKSSKWNCYTFRVDALDISFVRDWHRGSRVLPLFFEILIHSFLCFLFFLHSYRQILCLKPFPFQSSQVILVKLATHTLYYI